MRVQLSKIKQIRQNNNDLWMQILRVALEHSPDETKALLSGIRANDIEVTEQIQGIIDEDSQD